MMITPLYTAIAALLFVCLSFRTVMLRRRLGIAIGTANNKQMLRAARVHANFSEYTPMALLLIYFLESQSSEPLVIHSLCVAFLLGRCLHAYGVSQMKERLKFRVSGMVLTLSVIISASFGLIATYMSSI